MTGFKQRISELTMVPAGGGCFEVTVDGQLIYSKLKTGDFPDETVVVDTVGQLLKKPRP